MEIRPSISRRILVILAILLVGTAFLMVGLNALNQESLFGVPLPTGAAKYAEGYAAAKAQYERLCPQIGQEQKGFSGKILSINTNRMSISSDKILNDPMTGLSDKRELVITDTTTFQLRTKKSQEQILQEARNAKPGEPPPAPYTIVESTINDFKIDDTIYVMVQEDAKTNRTLTVTTVAKYTNP